MNVGKNIRSYRQNLNMYQEDLADKVYVSRQTIHTWEPEKSYPDVQSLLMKSQCFQIYFDQLIEGSIEKRKKIEKKTNLNPPVNSKQ
ncbi:helix-turn-helix transcriptional regulator [Streptococcus hyovaginalis]